jgi:hypothetical protein
MRQRILRFAIVAALHSTLLQFNGVAALAAEGNALSQVRILFDMYVLSPHFNRAEVRQEKHLYVLKISLRTILCIFIAPLTAN